MHTSPAVPHYGFKTHMDRNMWRENNGFLNLLCLHTILLLAWKTHYAYVEDKNIEFALFPVTKGSPYKYLSSYLYIVNCLTELCKV